MTQALTTRLIQLHRAFLTAMAMLLLGGLPALSAASETHNSETSQVRLVTTQNGIAPDTSQLSAGLHVDLNEGWKTYWRTPGEAGIPPNLDWSGSTNVASVEFQYPEPKRFLTFGIENIGYEDEVLFPLVIRLKDEGKPAQLRANVNLLVCEDICVPEILELALDLGRGISFDPAASELIARFAERVPTLAEEPAKYFIDENATFIQFELPVGNISSDAEFFPEMGISTFGTASVFRDQNNDRTFVSFQIDYLDTEAKDVRISLFDGDTRLEFATEQNGAPFAAIAKSAASSLPMILMFAFLGGLILNVMPCVLPVLAIKLSSAVKKAGDSSKRIRQSFLASSLGIISFMLVLAGLVIVLKSMGHSVGWGMHFQSGYFLGFMLALVLLFAANLAGVFEITLPHRMNTAMSRDHAGQGLLGDYVTGAIAAILATPCSAPFLGTAVAFALTSTSAHIVLIFAVLGMGLAAPYLLVALFPNLIAKLPKPGAWMVKVRVLMAALLLATALWLAWLMTNLVDLWVVLSVVAFAVVAIAILWKRSARAGWGSVVTSLLALGLATALPGLSGAVESRTNQQAGGIAWGVFDQSSITEAVARGNTVFVDVTADWCLTCKANKALVLDRGAVQAALQKENIVAVKADWTLPNAEITEFLNSHNRFGIPFNIIYGPGAEDGLILPEILTKKAVLAALETAAGTALLSQK